MGEKQRIWYRHVGVHARMDLVDRVDGMEWKGRQGHSVNWIRHDNGVPRRNDTLYDAGRIVDTWACSALRVFAYLAAVGLGTSTLWT